METRLVDKYNKHLSQTLVYNLQHTGIELLGSIYTIWPAYELTQRAATCENIPHQTNMKYRLFAVHIRLSQESLRESIFVERVDLRVDYVFTWIITGNRTDPKENLYWRNVILNNLAKMISNSYFVYFVFTQNLSTYSVPYRRTPEPPRFTTWWPAYKGYYWNEGASTAQLPETGKHIPTRHASSSRTSMHTTTVLYWYINFAHKGVTWNHVEWQNIISLGIVLGLITVRGWCTVYLPHEYVTNIAEGIVK